MPRYDYSCPTCGHTVEEIRSVADRNNCPTCTLCNVVMEKQIGGHYVQPDMAPYWDDNLQTGIKSRQHRKEVMREQGVSEKFGTDWWTARSSKRRVGVRR